MGLNTRKIVMASILMGMLSTGLFATTNASACVWTIRHVRVRRCHVGRWGVRRWCRHVIVRRRVCVRPLY